ncbi:MAG: hypothetical protein M0R51_09785 [Clostridia bacterium]|jgi:hypothetical protein|nr:hypothetical protein [Clostridia bacterium]
MDRFDEFAKHYIDLEFSGNTVSEYMSDMLNDMENDINDYISDEKSVPTKNAYNRITDYINKSISDYSDKVKEYINKIVNKTIKMEDKWITGMLSASIAADIIIPKINFMPFNGKITIGKFLDDAFASIYTSYDTTIRTAYMFKSQLSSLTDTLKNRNNNINSRASQTSQGIIPSVAKNTDRYVMARDKSIKMWTWISMLDIATCISCGDLSGTTYTDLSNAPPCPLHDRCRCYLYPDKASQPSYYEWFEKQDDSYKYKILGKTRYNLYKSGSKVKNFVNNGKKLTLEEIFSKKT